METTMMDAYSKWHVIVIAEIENSFSTQMTSLRIIYSINHGAS